MEKFSKLKELIAGVEADADKFYNSGNGAAGTRVRKAMQDLKGLAQEIRAEVTEKKIQSNSTLIIFRKASRRFISGPFLFLGNGAVL
jgi:hypothetical protein